MKPQRWLAGATLVLSLVVVRPAAAEDLGGDPTQGQELWTRAGLQDPDRGGRRSCTTCHGQDPRQPGRHATTGKVIPPMAPVALPSRFSDAAHREKWFLRNCKWTLGRECSAAEKANVLAYLNSLTVMGGGKE
ncbi:MAG: DUF1924 domain-containing protein [Magnetococcales bacterium]|nr:DUF1924 domain-containing protein [Magnetococcales bacterium]